MRTIQGLLSPKGAHVTSMESVSILFPTLKIDLFARKVSSQLLMFPPMVPLFKSGLNRKEPLHMCFKMLESLAYVATENLECGSFPLSDSGNVKYTPYFEDLVGKKRI